MRKIIYLVIIIMLLSACSDQTVLTDEPYEPVEYKLYPRPEGAYVGDVMPFVTEEGELELYYLYDTDHNGQGYHPIWKYSTDDLVGYTDHGMMLDFGLMSDPDPALGTGSVLRDIDGLYHLFYTGHNDTGNNGRGKECVMHAVSSDRENWTKMPEDTFFGPDGYSKDDFRDPEVFWMEEDQRYWLLIAARDDKEGGVVAKYTSTDLQSWEFDGPLFAPHDQYMLECPDLFKIDDTWYLTYSWDCVTYYAMSEFPNGPFTVPEDNVLDGTGFIFYAAKTAELNGARYLCGWLGRAALTDDSGYYLWAGNVLSHQLVQLADKRLGVREPETFSDYFTEEKPFTAVKKEGKAKIDKKKRGVTLSPEENEYALVDMGTRAPTMTVECDVTMSGDGCVGFAFGGNRKYEYWTGLCLDAKQDMLHYEGIRLEDLEKYDSVALTHFDFSAGRTYHVKLICENEIVIMYVDDTKALSSRIRHSTDGAHIGLFAEGCDAEFTNITMRIPQS